MVYFQYFQLVFFFLCLGGEVISSPGHVWHPSSQSVTPLPPITVIYAKFENPIGLCTAVLQFGT